MTGRIIKTIKMSNKYNIRYLEKTEFVNWDTFVDECFDGTIFNKTIWLDNLYKSKGNINFKILGCFDKDSKLLGGFAFGYIKKFSLFSIIVPPSLTPYSGILIKERPSKYTSKVENYKLNISNEIISFLNREFSQITLILSPTYNDIRGYIWNNFSEKVLYTYSSIIDNPGNLFESFDPDVKRQINKLENTDFTINKNDSIKTFFDLQEKSFLRQQYSFKLSKTEFFEFLKGLDSEKCYKVYTIYEAGIPSYSTVILIHKQTAYYWLAGGDPAFFAKGHNKILLWEIILDLNKEGVKYFDFVGANTPSISKYKSNFGLNLVPYYYLEKTNNRFLKLLLAIKSIIKKY